MHPSVCGLNQFKSHFCERAGTAIFQSLKHSVCLSKPSLYTPSAAVWMRQSDCIMHVNRYSTSTARTGDMLVRQSLSVCMHASTACELITKVDAATV